jgi:uncharacterized membrane protein
MAKDLGDAIGAVLGKATRGVAKTVATNARKPGVKGVAAGAGFAALAPLAARGVGKLVHSNGAESLKRFGDKVSANGLLPGSGGDDGDAGDTGDAGEPLGVGKGRRMPVQQSVDVAVPIDTAYNQWTQFEEWPNFMHRVESAVQEDDSHVRFKTKIWAISREFEAEILEQRPNERIKWRVTEGVTHTGVVTFHGLADRLTRIEVSLDVQPGSLIEKAGRGMRHVKRAVRADLARFKAFVEMYEEETGAWRGEIDDGKVKRRRTTSASSGSRSRSSSTRSGSGRKSSSARGGRSRPSSGSPSGGGRTRSSSGGGRTRSSSGGGRTPSSSGGGRTRSSSASDGRRKASRSSARGSRSGSGSGSGSRS